MALNCHPRKMDGELDHRGRRMESSGMSVSLCLSGSLNEDWCLEGLVFGKT